MLAHWLPDHVSPHIIISCSMYQFVCRHLLGHGKRLSKIVFGCLLLSFPEICPVVTTCSFSSLLTVCPTNYNYLLLVPVISCFCVFASCKTFRLCIVFSTFFCKTFTWLVWIYLFTNCHYVSLLLVQDSCANLT